jgi:hypothetical protein
VHEFDVDGRRPTRELVARMSCNGPSLARPRLSSEYLEQMVAGIEAAGYRFVSPASL